MRTLTTMIFILLLICQNVFGQQKKIIVGGGYSHVLPIGNFSNNINRDAIFGFHYYLIRSIGPKHKWSIGATGNIYEYDQSSFHNLKIYPTGIAHKQKFVTTAGLIHGSFIVRRNFNPSNSKFKFYVEGLLGLDYFFGTTSSSNAQYSWDTNNDGVIDPDIDAVVIPGEIGVASPPDIPKSSFSNDLSISMATGIGIGASYKLFNGWHLNVSSAYIYGHKASYFDSGSENMYHSSRDAFLIVTSNIHRINLSLGLCYEFTKFKSSK